jgi:hypothetical protein
VGRLPWFCRPAAPTAATLDADALVILRREQRRMQRFRETVSEFRPVYLAGSDEVSTVPVLQQMSLTGEPVTHLEEEHRPVMLRSALHVPGAVGAVRRAARLKG